MTSELSAFNAAEENYKDNNVKFNNFKNEVLNRIKDVSENWIFNILDKEVKRDLKVKLDLTRVFIDEELNLIESLAFLEFVQSNFNLILDKYSVFEDEVEMLFDAVDGELLFDEFKSECFLYYSGRFPEYDLSINKDSIYRDFKINFENKKSLFLDYLKFQIEINYDSCMSYSKFFGNFKGALTLNLNATIESLNKELEGFRRLRNIADNAKTENIYDNAVNKYKGLEEFYRSYFYRGIGIVVTISILLLFLKTLIVPSFFSNIEFWVLKGSILIVGITLITYFLKQSSHYQHLADQNYQTQVELQAYPTFMESIPTEEAASVRKELALKYFGREIDGAAHKDMSNLIADQMKSTTEMVKASTEAIKNLKG